MMKFKFTEKEPITYEDDKTKPLKNDEGEVIKDENDNIFGYEKDKTKPIYDSWTEEYKTLEDITPEMTDGITLELISYRCSECKMEIESSDMVEAKFGVCKKCKGKI